MACVLQEIAAGAAGLAMSTPLREAGEAVAHAAMILGSMWPAAGSDAAPTPHPDH